MVNNNSIHNNNDNGVDNNYYNSKTKDQNKQEKNTIQYDKTIHKMSI